MDEQLQQMERDLEQREKELNILSCSLEVRETELSHREQRASMGLDVTSIRQEFLRRAIEVGSNALDRLDGMKVSIKGTTFKHLEELIDTAAVKLEAELQK